MTEPTHPRPDRTIDRERLKQTLGDPVLARVVTRLRDRLCRDRDLSRPLRLSDPSEDERRTLASILGMRPRRGSTLTFSPEILDATLRQSGISPGGLVVALEALGGALRDPRDEATRCAKKWDAAVTPTRTWIAEQDTDARRAALTSWLQDLISEGLLKRLATIPEDAVQLLARTQRVIDRLPAASWTLPELAARSVGDAHALDSGQALATLVQRAIGRITHRKDDADTSDTSDTSDAAGRRRLWRRVHVSVDALSASVLTLGLRGVSDGLVDRTLAIHAEANTPCRLTEDALLRHPPRFSADVTGARVFVCENPAVIAAARREVDADALLGPLICTEGQPSTAVRLLLDNLSGAGISIHVHADFDAAGAQIVALIVARHGAKPWRFDAKSYRHALSLVREAGIDPTSLPRQPASGRPRDTTESPLLTAMQTVGTIIHEELLIETLLRDVGMPTRPHDG